MERFVGIKEVAEFLSIKEMTIYAWRHKGIIPCYKLKGKLLFRLSELNRLIENCKEPLLTK